MNIKKLNESLTRVLQESTTQWYFYEEEDCLFMEQVDCTIPPYKNTYPDFQIVKTSDNQYEFTAWSYEDDSTSSFCIQVTRNNVKDLVQGIYKAYRLMGCTFNAQQVNEKDVEALPIGKKFNVEPGEYDFHINL